MGLREELARRGTDNGGQQPLLAATAAAAPADCPPVVRRLDGTLTVQEQTGLDDQSERRKVKRYPRVRPDVPQQEDHRGNDHPRTPPLPQHRDWVPFPTPYLVRVPENGYPGQVVSFAGPEGIEMQAVVPEGREPGEEFQVRLPPTAILKVPPGKSPGDVMFFEGLGDVRMRTVVPSGKRPGDRFQVPLLGTPNCCCVSVPETMFHSATGVIQGPGGTELQAIIPKQCRIGDRFEVPIRAPVHANQVTLRVPEGVVPGEDLTFSGPGGVQMQVKVPEGKKPGSHFKAMVASFAHRRQLLLRVQDGVSGGQQIQVQSPDGTSLTTVVPEGLKAGDSFVVSLASRQHYSLGQLCTAASSDDLEAVKRWVAEGVSVNGVYDLGFTPLIYAAMHGRAPAVRWLLEMRADIKALTNDRRTPLHFAARNGHTEVARILIDSKSPTDVPDVLGRTPLATAIGKNQLETAEALRAAGCV